MADTDDATSEDTQLSTDEVYETATSFISPALREELLRTQLSCADIVDIGPVYAKTLPARHRRSSSKDEDGRARRYSATSRVDRIILKSLLEAEPEEVETKTLPRKSIRHLPGKMSFKKQLCNELFHPQEAIYQEDTNSGSMSESIFLIWGGKIMKYPL